MTKMLPTIGRRDAFSVQDVFGSLQREMDRVFDDFGRGFEAWNGRDLTPKFDVSETDSEIDITAELPGLEEKDVDVSLSDGALTISGEKKADKEKKGKDYWYAERSYGAFSRRLPMPPGVDASSVKASMAKGVLSVTVTKPAGAAAKKIEVKSA